MNGEMQVRYAPLIALIGSIAVCLALSLPLVLALLFSALAAYVTGRRAGFSGRDLLRFGWQGVQKTRPVLLILFFIGLLIPLLMVGGAVPTLIYHGLSMVNVNWLLTLSFVLTSAVSHLLGTSVGTLSTIGLALMGIGLAAQIPPGMMAGALISGAMVGERFSPFSSSRMLALSTIEADEREVTRFALPTGLAALAGCAGLFALLDWWRPDQTANGVVAGYLRLFEQHYSLSLWSLLPLALMIGLFVFRVKAVNALAVGVAVAAVQAAVLGEETGRSLFSVILYGMEPATGTELDRLVHGGGMLAILEVLALITAAGFMNGILDKANLLAPVVERLIGHSGSDFALVAKTAVLSLMAAVISCNQTIPLLVVGSTMRDRFAASTGGIALLGRTMLDATLVMPVLVPWNGLAMVMSVTLGVPTVASLPFLLFPLLLPLVTVFSTRFAGSSRNRPMAARTGH